MRPWQNSPIGSKPIVTITLFSAERAVPRPSPTMRSLGYREIHSGDRLIEYPETHRPSCVPRSRHRSTFKAEWRSVVSFQSRALEDWSSLGW
jgi:hypothetical protein